MRGPTAGDALISHVASTEKNEAGKDAQRRQELAAARSSGAHATKRPLAAGRLPIDARLARATARLCGGAGIMSVYR